MDVGAAEYPHPPGVAFELVGVDFLVDSALRPWLLEFNAVPSMARQVIADKGTAGIRSLLAEMKYTLVSQTIVCGLGAGARPCSITISPQMQEQVMPGNLSSFLPFRC